MDADPLAPLLFAIKLGLYGSALLASGLGLHVSFGIVARKVSTGHHRACLLRKDLGDGDLI